MGNLLHKERLRPPKEDGGEKNPLFHSVFITHSSQ